MERFIDSSHVKTKRNLDRGVVKALNPPQHGLVVIGKSSIPWEKLVS
jgi:hypothetical protein